MRQSVQALALVTFDAPADVSVYHLWDVVADALITGSHATVEPTAVELRALREEAAMFNSNGDQWEADGICLSQGPKLGFAIKERVPRPFDQPWRGDVIAKQVAEALNFMAGRPIPRPDVAPPSPASRETRLIEAAEAMLAAYGGDVPAWLRDEASALEAAVAVSKLGQEPRPPVPEFKCEECGNDGRDDGLVLTIDAKLNPDTGRWILYESGEGLDCTACDHKTHVSGPLFPDGAEISPDGREVVL